MSRGRAGVWAALLLLVACGSREEAPSAPPAALEVWGHMESGRQSIAVFEDGEGVADALVEVDGQRLYQTGFSGWYEGHLSWPEPVTGDTLSLRVTRGASVVTGSGILPEAPVLTSPADGGIYSHFEAIPVAWTISRSPDRFQVDAQWTCGYGSATYAFDSSLEPRPRALSGSARALTIPANWFFLCDGSGTLALSVRAINAGSLGGDYVPYSGDHRDHPGMNIGAESNAATLRE